MMPPSCAWCLTEFSNGCLPKILPNCTHTICEQCVDNECSPFMNGQSLCPVCKAPVNVRSAHDLPTNNDLLDCGAPNSYVQHESSTRAHVIGHNWLVKLRENASLCQSSNVDFSFQLIPDNTFLEIFKMARNGQLQQHQNLVVFACIPLVWCLHQPSAFPNLTLFLPNKAFNRQGIKGNIIALMEALTTHRRDTKLYMFLPSLIDVDRFNRQQIEYFHLSYDKVAQVCPQIQTYHVLNHTRFYMKEILPANFTDIPSNIYIIYGHNAAMKISTKLSDNMMNFIRQKSSKLYLQDLYSNGVDPTNDFVCEIYKAICKALNRSQNKTSIESDMSPNKFSNNSGFDVSKSGNVSPPVRSYGVSGTENYKDVFSPVSPFGVAKPGNFSGANSPSMFNVSKQGNFSNTNFPSVSNFGVTKQGNFSGTISPVSTFGVTKNENYSSTISSSMSGFDATKQKNYPRNDSVTTTWFKKKDNENDSVTTTWFKKDNKNDSKPSNCSELLLLESKNNSINHTKELSPDDTKHLMDATSEEILRSAEYLKTIRDTCYPSVTNEELSQVALRAIQQYFN